MDMDENILLLLGGGPEEEEEEELVVKKRKKKKQLSPKQLKKQQQKLEEQARIAEQLAREKMLADTKERVQKEIEYHKTKTQVFASEHDNRTEQLHFTFDRLNEINAKWLEYQDYLQSQREWEEYMKNNRLPDPSSLAQMNTYIYVWTEVEREMNVPYCINKTKEVIELLDGLADYIHNPGWDCSPKLIRDWKKMHNKIRYLLEEQINRTTYSLFRKIETSMSAVNVTTSTYLLECPYFKMCLWAELIMPIPSSNETDVKLPLSINFEEIGMSVTLPVSLVEIHKVVQAVWMNYDHWTDRCRSFEDPPIPEFYKKDLWQLTVEEYELKKEILDHREIQQEKLKRKVGHVAPEATISQELMAWGSEPQRILSDEVAFQRGQLEIEWQEGAKLSLNEFEVNLRERTFLGGVIFFDVMYQPPQPKYLRYKHDVTLITEEPKLHSVQFYEKYSLPDPAVVPSKEKVETKSSQKIFETKTQGSKIITGSKVTVAGSKATVAGSKIAIEVSNEEKLVEITLKLPQTVLWFEPPVPAIWDPRHSYWSTEDVHKINFNPEEEILSFRAGRLGVIGLHVNRYCNIPYEDWYLEPDGRGNVNFSLKTNKISLKFNIQENKVCLESIENEPSKAINWLLGIYYTPMKLIQILIEAGINVFPPLDAGCYVPNLESKNYVVENHVYEIWGLFSLCFAFKFSKFNQVAGSRNLVFLAREIHKNRETSFCVIRTSPADAIILNVAEDSGQFSLDPAPGMGFNADLYNLIMKNCTSNAKRKIEETNFLLIKTIKELMINIRPLSYSYRRAETSPPSETPFKSK